MVTLSLGCHVNYYTRRIRKRSEWKMREFMRERQDRWRGVFDCNRISATQMPVLLVYNFTFTSSIQQINHCDCSNWGDPLTIAQPRKIWLSAHLVKTVA